MFRKLLITMVVITIVGISSGVVLASKGNATYTEQPSLCGSTVVGNNLLEKFAPLVPDSVDGYAIPKEIDGYPVVFVGTFDKIPWLQPGQVEIILLGNSRMEESMLNTSLNNSLIEFLNAHPRQWSVDVTGGPNFSIDEFLSNLEVCIENYTGPVYSGGPGPSGPVSLSAP